DRRSKVRQTDDHTTNQVEGLVGDDGPQRYRGTEQEKYKAFLCVSESLWLVAVAGARVRRVDCANAFSRQAAPSRLLRPKRRVPRLHQSERPSAVQNRH